MGTSIELKGVGVGVGGICYLFRFVSRCSRIIFCRDTLAPILFLATKTIFLRHTVLSEYLYSVHARDRKCVHIGSVSGQWWSHEILTVYSTVFYIKKQVLA